MTSTIQLYVAIVALANAGSIGIGISMVQADNTYAIDGKVAELNTEYSKATKCETPTGCWSMQLSKSVGTKHSLGVTALLYDDQDTIFDTGETNVIDICQPQIAGSWEAGIAGIAKKVLLPNGLADCPIDLQKYSTYSIYKEFEADVTAKDQLNCGDYKLALEINDHGDEDDSWTEIGTMLATLTIPNDGNCK